METMIIENNRLNNKGFSLVELSIVLVILGLLVGGVMSGQSLIKAAELRSVTSEFQQWQTAVNVFKDKYFALPGDMPNATAFWTADSGCNADGTGGNAAPGNLGGDALDGTCDGDGSGLVANYWTTADRYEVFLFWNHLQLAGLIPGQYTGVQGPTGGSNCLHVIGENAPRAKFSNGGWSAWSYNTGNTAYFNLDYGNVLEIGASHSTCRTENPLFTPEEAWNVDSKFDDGRPGQGNVIARNWNNACADASSNTDYDADYRLSDATVRCVLLFRNAF